MQRVICLVRDELMGSHAHHNIRRLDAYDYVVIVKLLYHAHLVKSALNYSLCGHSAVLLHEILLQRTTVYTDPYRNISLSGSLDYLCQLLLSSDIPRIYPDLVHTIFYGLYGKPVVKMYVAHKRNVDLFLYSRDCICCSLIVYRTSDYVTSGLLKLEYLCNRSLHIARLCVGHGLYKYRIASAYNPVTYVDLSCLHIYSQRQYISTGAFPPSLIVFN